MSVTYLPLVALMVFAAAMAVAMIAVGHFVGPRRSTPVKRMPYESGMDPRHDARRRFDIHFHLIAILFLLFDVELLFLYPWAVARAHPEGLAALAEAGWPVDRVLILGEVLFFLLLLALGWVYVWRRGILRWR